jgi:hypothetical protein
MALDLQSTKTIALLWVKSKGFDLLIGVFLVNIWILNRVNVTSL